MDIHIDASVEKEMHPMKSNKEKVYDFIRLHADEKADRGISTAYIADAMELQRTNVSSILNLLVQEGRIQKCNGRPVLYKVGREFDRSGRKSEADHSAGKGSSTLSTAKSQYVIGGSPWNR